MIPGERRGEERLQSVKCCANPIHTHHIHKNPPGVGVQVCNTSFENGHGDRDRRVKAPWGWVV